MEATAPAARTAALPRESSPTTVETAPRAAATPDEEFLASGPIVVENQVEVTSEREGVVAELFAETGAVVHKGELLARLDDRQLTADRDAGAAQARSIAADVKNWEASVQVADTDKKRSEEMFQAKLITNQQVDHDRYKLIATQYEADRERENYKRALAAQQSLELELEKTRITAPFDGVVARRYIRTGQSVSKDQKLFWVSATGPLRIKFTLPERYLSKINRGSVLTVVAPDSPKDKHPAKVLLVSPIVDPGSGTIEVTAELTGPTGILRPGMTVNVIQNPPKPLP